MEALTRNDAGRIQGGTDFETDTQSTSRLDAALRIEATENANEVFGTTMAKDQHENYKRHLWEGQASFEWRLGVW